MGRRSLHLALSAALVIAGCGPGSAGGSLVPVTPSPGAEDGRSPGATVITVIGEDYLYRGMPSSVPVGTVLRFENASAVEAHEMVVTRKREGVTESFAQILALPEREAQEKIIQAGHAFALPGQAAEQEFTIDTPGHHAIICFIPVGSVPSHVHEPDDDAGAVDIAHAGETDQPGDGAPHYTLGMIQEFTVTD